MLGIIITPDKHVTEREITGLKDLQQIVGGWIEPVDLNGACMYVNEEYGYLFGPDQVNWVATDVAGLGGRPDLMLRNPILGSAVLVGPLDLDGESTDVTDRARRWVRRVGREAGATFA